MKRYRITNSARTTLIIGPGIRQGQTVEGLELTAAPLHGTDLMHGIYARAAADSINALMRTAGLLN